jgi:transposase
VQQPAVKAVAVKSEAQQAVLALHRMRSQLVKFRTAQINGLRGLLAEYGEVMPQGRAGITKGIATALAKLVDRLPAVLLDTLREQWVRVGKLDEQVAEIERRLRAWHKEDKASRRIAEIPGVGLLTATAAVASMGDPKSFKSGREFAAWLGLVPKHTGTGGRIRMLGISKRGDTYLRTLLIHGARSVIANSKQPSEWVTNLTQRKPANVAVVALANKMARTIWALLAHEREFQKGYVSQPV